MRNPLRLGPRVQEFSLSVCILCDSIPGLIDKGSFEKASNVGMCMSAYSCCDVNKAHVSVLLVYIFPLQYLRNRQSRDDQETTSSVHDCRSSQLLLVGVHMDT